MKRSLVCWTLTVFVLTVLLTACCGGGTETVVVPAENGPTTGQELQDLKTAHDQDAITDEEYEKQKEKVLKK